MINFKRVLAGVLSLALSATLLVSCTNDSDNGGKATEAPSSTKAPSSANDAALTETFVAKVGDQKIYSNEFYYFLYTGLREVYYGAENVYDDSLSEDENYQKMLDFLETENEDGKKYLDVVIERTLEIAAGFRIAVELGKEEIKKNPDYEISQKEIEEALATVDTEADYGASYYKTTRDEFFFYAYGMNVNDAKRYTEAQMYAQLHEEIWAKENGYVLEAVAPTEPKKPEEPKKLDDDATEDEKTAYDKAVAEYNTALKKYNEDFAKYESELSVYEKALGEYWEKFRAEYDEALVDGTNTYDITTVRYLYVSTLDKDGKTLSEDECARKKADAEKYLELTNDGMDFESMVKGFSDSLTATTDLGLFDINMLADLSLVIPEEAILWACDNAVAVDSDAKLFKDDSGYYIVKKVGLTTFDGTDGITASDATTDETVKSNVEYFMLAELYNKVVDEAAASDKFAVTDADYEAMQDLAQEYLSYNSEDFEK